MGTEEDKLSYDSYRPPKFVVVDDETGEVIAGSFWSGTSCTRMDGDPDWTCIGLHDYMHVTFPLEASEGHLVREIDLATDGDHEFVLRNDLAAPGCTLKDEEVRYLKTGSQVEVWGGGVTEYDDDTWAIPMSCPNVGNKSTFSAPLPNTVEHPVGPSRERWAYTTAEYPGIWKTSWDTGRVLEDSFWEVDHCIRPTAIDEWACETQSGIQMDSDGQHLIRDVELRDQQRWDAVNGGALVKFTYRETQAPGDHDLTDARFTWTGTEDGWDVVATDANGDPDPEAQDLVYPLGNGTENVWAIANTRNGDTPTVPTDPSESTKPSEPSESTKPSDSTKPSESTEPSGSVSPSSSAPGGVKPGDGSKPSGSAKPSASGKPGSTSTSTKPGGAPATPKPPTSGSSGGGSLARTGVSVLGLIVVAAAAIAGGAYLVRRNRAE